jgi:hypothetical protein
VMERFSHVFPKPRWRPRSQKKVRHPWTNIWALSHAVILGIFSCRFPQCFLVFQTSDIIRHLQRWIVLVVTSDVSFRVTGEVRATQTPIQTHARERLSGLSRPTWIGWFRDIRRRWLLFALQLSISGPAHSNDLFCRAA